MEQRFVRFLVIFGAIVAASVSRVGADTFDIITVQHPSPNVEVVNIGQPNVKQAVTQYSQITFAPGDSVVVAAEGCVQTGGTGSTWKRYVNPSGSNSDHLYFGEIWIPGATGVLVPIAGVIGKTLSVPSGASNVGLFLRLGYSDDNYSDNGYYSHDNGTENQCAGSGGGPASVTLTITHNGSTGTQTGDVAPFDLFWTQVDANAIPLQARWGEQLNHDRDPANHPTGLAGDDTCGTPWKVPCTTQGPSLDRASFPNSWFSCDHQGGPLNGHVKWGPGTYSGALSWESKSSPVLDDDYSINLSTTNDDGATEGRPQGYHTEFDSDETIDNFTSSWWNTLHHAVDNENTFPTPEDLLNDKFAIVTGLIDLDCAHPCSGELHPVYAMAIRYIGDTNYEQWAIFVRNWGDEGGCSSDDHQLLLDNNQYTIVLPWPPNATSVAFGSATEFETNNSSTSISVVNVTPGVGTELTFNLPSPDKHALIDGLLELNYTLPAGPSPKPTPTPKTGKIVSTTSTALTHVVEPALYANIANVDEDALPPMTAGQLKIYQSQLPAASLSPDRLRLKIPASHVLSTTAWLSLRRQPAKAVPRVEALPDSAKLARDTARIHAVYAAFGGAVPGLGPLPAGPGITAHPILAATPPSRP
ncbi:MAG: hypothetical protein WBD74_02870 [Candidatus Aquilonibacter sp.]